MIDSNNLSAGSNIPYDINVIVEIPAYSDPVKYEVDKKSGRLEVNRFMATAMRYPCNYGYVPSTLAADGDPLDVLVISPFNLFNGVLIKCRPLGMLKMEDESGDDSKIIVVPHDSLTEIYSDIKEYSDLPKPLLHTIKHFFQHYKDLEKGKWVRVDGWVGLEEAYNEIKKSIIK